MRTGDASSPVPELAAVGPVCPAASLRARSAFRTSLVRLFSVVLVWQLAAEAGVAQTWSPSGDWLSYVLKEARIKPSEADQMAWILGRGTAMREQGAASASRDATEVLWVTEVDTGVSIALDRVDGELTEAGWSKDGSGLLFGRVIWADQGKTRRQFELVRQTGPERQVVLKSWPWPGGRAGLDDDDRRAVLWSADGAWLVAPLSRAKGLIVLDATTGRVARELPGATRPRWSYEGDKLAYVEGGSKPRLWVLSVRDDQTALVSELPAPTEARLPAPQWSRDGRRLMLLNDIASGARQRVLRLESFALDPPRPEPAYTLVEGPTASNARLISASYAFDAAETYLFYTVEAQDQPSSITWIRGPNGEVYKRFHPFLDSEPMGSIVVCPRPGKPRLALRLGVPGWSAPPLICEPDQESLVPIVPDESARAVWVEILKSGIATLLDTGAPRSEEFAPRDLRPSRLPMPGELSPEDPTAKRLKRLARIGKQLFAIEATPGRWSASVRGWPSHAAERLLFAALAGDGKQALALLDELNPEGDTEEDRLRWLGLRAQLAMGERRWDVAGGIVDYLLGIARQESYLLDADVSGLPVRLEPASRTESWIRALQTRFEALRRGEPSVPPDEYGFGIMDRLERAAEEFGEQDVQI